MSVTQSIKRNVTKFFMGGSVDASMWGWSIPGMWNRKAILRQYTRYVYTIISAIAQDAGKVDFVVEKTGKSGAKTPVLSHPFIQLMKRPNPDMSQFQFLELHFTFINLMGESFWYVAKREKSKKPGELYLIRPDLMDIAVDQGDKTGLVTGYVLSKPDGTKIPLEKDEVLHFKLPNPQNAKRGMGPVEAGKVYIETEEYGAEWTRNSLFNSGRPSGILSIKGVITGDEFRKLKQQFNDTYAGSKNAGKTMLIKGSDGLDYQKLSMELGEVALHDLKNMTRDDIMIMFRVSKTLLGISDDVNRANAREARAVFIENIIKPQIERFIDHLNAFLMPMWGDGTDVNITYKDPTMLSDADKLAEWTAGINRWLTVNDVRKERGLEALDGGDTIYQAVSMVPMGSDNSVPSNDTQKEVKKKAK